MISSRSRDARLKTPWHFEKPWDQRLQLLLAFIVAINIAPHAWNIPTWATVWAAIALVWKVAYLKRGIRLPRRSVLAFGGIVASALTFRAYDTIFGVEAASCLLVLLVSLKLLETNRYRDAMLVIFTSYFLLMAHLLVSQTLLSTLFMACDILLITSLMFHMHKRDRRKSVRGFRPAMRMLALTMPVWFLFFFLFPRFTAAVWDLKPGGSRTGFSDEMNPGVIEELVQDDEPAFRVTFRTRNPSPEILYWRGEVLSHGEGLRWSKGRPDQGARSMTGGDPPNAEYDVVLEPGFQRWLFVLDYVHKFRAGEWLSRTGIRRTDLHTYRANQDFSVRVAYSAVSSRELATDILSDDERRAYLQVPTKLSPRVQALAQQIAKHVSSTGADRTRSIDANARKYFVESNFRYSLRPGALTSVDGRSQLDEFLFEKKVGFCEHFSAAYATLMRLAGIPARVVVGFQGGKYNDYGNYLLVRHLDAHAWTEIWLSDDGKTGRWMRIDLTQDIAPLRLQLGGDYYRLEPQQLAGLTSEELRRQLEGSWVKILLNAQLAWDAVQMKWNAFLMEYDLSYQLELLTRLGFRNASILLLIASLASGLLVIAIIFVVVLRVRSRRSDPVLETWNRFCVRLGRSGIHRALNEGPLDFTERAASANPKAADQIRAIGRSYMQLRYGKPDGSNSVSAFKAQVRRFSPPKLSSSIATDS